MLCDDIWQLVTFIFSCCLLRGVLATDFWKQCIQIILCVNKIRVKMNDLDQNWLLLVMETIRQTHGP